MNAALNADLPINLFDAAVYLCLALAIIAGLRSGLLRSLATIFGYAVAVPVALALMPYLTPILTDKFKLPPAQTSLAFFGVFFVIGFILAALMRTAVGEVTGGRIGAADRAGGAFLGAIRVVLLSVLMVLVFERLISPGREPAFLAGSTLRPILSQAGQQGLRRLPPERHRFHRPRETRTRAVKRRTFMTLDPVLPRKLSLWRVLGKALVGGLVGFVAAPIIVFGVVLILNAFNKVCGTPGDSGGCEMGLFAAAVASALPGTAIGFIVSLVRTLRRR